MSEEAKEILNTACLISKDDYEAGVNRVQEAVDRLVAQTRREAIESTIRDVWEALAKCTADDSPFDAVEGVGAVNGINLNELLNEGDG